MQFEAIQNGRLEPSRGLREFMFDSNVNLITNRLVNIEELRIISHDNPERP
jgi:hypothetical protein